MIGDTIERLKNECEALVLSDGYRPMPHDIDILIEPRFARSAREVLDAEGCTTVHDSGGKIQAIRFEEGQPFFLDIAYTFDYLEEVFPQPHLFPNIRAQVEKDPAVETFIRYLYLLRGETKHLDFMRANFAVYRHVLFDPRYVGNPLFRSTLTLETALGIMQKKPGAFVRGLTLSALASFLVANLWRRVRRIGTGSIIAVVGPDGSGKTTVVKELVRATSGRRMYMGDWGFLLQPLYTRMHAQHILIARLTYLFFYVENWLRYVRAWLLKMNGRIVIIDRYPGLNRHLRRNDVWLRMNDLLYTLFPRADRYIFISLDPEEIHRRKPELSVAEIAESQKNMRTRLKKRRAIEIDNTDLDTCLNTALSYLYSR